MTRILRTLALSTALGLSLSPAWADVTIRYLASQGGLSAHELAAELGYFDGTGITLENVGYAQGGNDFVAAYPSNGINDDAQSVFYVLDDSPIHEIKDIVGKTIAVNTLGAHLDYVVREALHQAGLPENSANLVVVPGPQLEQVLRSHQVDISAFGYWQTTFTGAALKNGGLRAVFDDTDVLGEIAGGFVVLRRDWIAAHPAEAKAFVDGSVRALDYAREHPQETREIFARVLAERGENAEVAQYFAGYGVREGGLPVQRDIQFWIDVLERQGAIPAGKLKAADLLYVAGDSPSTN
jgi:ABC-type nitrate/sulfonate/bicarbonate transport system substrate-binding protein